MDAYAQTPASSQADPACPSADLGEECVYHITRALDTSDTEPNVIRIDNDTGKVYVTNRPTVASRDINYSYLRVYDSAENGYALIKEIRFNGTNSRIPDFEINTRTDELHVVHLAGVGDVSQGWGGIENFSDGTPTNWDGTHKGISDICKDPRGNRTLEEIQPSSCWDPSGNASLTTISLDTHDVVSTIEINHSEAWRNDTWTVERYQITDLALDRVRDRAYVATRDGPILTVDTENKALLPVLANYTSPGTEWNPSNASAGATALTVDEDTGAVYAAVRVGKRSDRSLHSWGIAALSFENNSISMPYYRQLHFLNLSSNPAPDSVAGCSLYNDYNAYPCNNHIWILSMHLDAALGKVFALYRNHTVVAFGLDESGYPVNTTTVHVRTPEESRLAGDSPIDGMLLDADRDLLYASLYDWTDPRVIVIDAGTHSRVGVASGTSQMRNMGLDASDGDVYVLPQWVQSAYVIEGEAKHPLQRRIDMASPGDTITIEPGIYGNAVLDVNKSLTLTSETGQPGAVVFTGYSRIEVEADDVTISGLSFQDTDCMPGYGASLVEIRTHHASQRSDITIKDNVFRNTCHAAVQKEGSSPLHNIAITGNVFENIGLKIPPGWTEPIDTGGENEFQILHGAIGLSHHPSQGTVAGTISDNHINGTSAAGIRVFNADNMVISNNYIANTPASAIGLAHGPSNVRVTGNTIVNANSEPDLDYLAGRDGTGEPDYYKTYYPLGPGRFLGMHLLDAPYWKPTPDAAINVWANGENINVTGNTIRASDGAFAVCTGVCAFESDGLVRGSPNDRLRNMPPLNADVSANIRFNENIVYAHNGTDNGGVLVRSNTTAGMLDATNNYFVGIDRSDTGAITAGRVDLGALPAVSPNASTVAGYDTYHVTGTIPLDNSGAWNLEVDAANNRLYVGTDPVEGSDHPDGSSIVYAYDLDSGELAGSYSIAGTAGRIADMEANPGTGELHVLHAWLANRTIADDWYRGAGGWGLNVTTLSGQDLSETYTARMSHHNQSGDYGLYPRETALSAGLEVAATRNLLFVSALEHTPIIVLDNSAQNPGPAAMGDPGAEGGRGAAYLVSAMAVNDTGPVITAYAAGADLRGSGEYDLYLNVVQFNNTQGGSPSIENYDRINRTLVSTSIAGYMGDRAREVVLDDAADRLFVLWYNNRTVTMYSLDETTQADRSGSPVGIPSYMATLEGTHTPFRDMFGGSGPTDISLDGDGGILYTVVQDVTDPRVLAHNSTTGRLLGAASLAGSPVSVEAAGGGMVYAASRAIPHVYSIDPQPASILQKMIDAAAPGGVVVVPDGAYNNTVLVVNKSLTLTSETGTVAASSAGGGGPSFTGSSRIQVEANNTAVRGLAFTNTACLPGLAPPLVEIGLPPGGAAQGSARSGIVVANSAFEDTCHAAVQQKGYGSLNDVAVLNNTLKNIGLNAGGDPLDTGGEDEFQLVHGAVGLAYHPGQAPVSGSVIAGNTIANTSAAGIRLFNAEGAMVYGNDISGTPASAVGISHASGNSAVLHNTITGANTEPDMDYLSGISGSGDDSYYMRLNGTRYATDGVPYAGWPGSAYWHAWPESLAPHSEAPTPDAAVKVWANSANVSVASNTIRSSGGAFVACAGTCAAESGGLVRADGMRNVLAPADYNVGSAGNRVTFNWNVVHADNALNGSDAIANNATGMLDATRNYYPGHEMADDAVRTPATVNYSSPARSVADVTAEPGSGKAVTAGDTIVFSVAFNAPTRLDTGSGTPSLLFGAPGAGPYAAAAYRNGSGATLYFAYTVQEGAGDLASAMPAAIALNGAILRGEPNPGAALALPLSLNASDFPAIDTTDPRVTGVSSSPSPQAYSRGDTVPIAVTFSEAVAVAGTPVLPLDAAGPSNAANATYSGGSGTGTLEFQYTVLAGHSSDRLSHLPSLVLPEGAAIRDLAGRNASLALPAAGSGNSLYDTSRISVDGDVAGMANLTTATPATADAVFTGKSMLRITYSAPLGPPAGYTGPVYGAITVDGEGGAPPLPVADGGVSGLGTAVHAVRFGGDGVTVNQTGSISLNTDLVGTTADGSATYAFTNDTIPVKAGTLARTAMPAGQMPVVTIERDGFVREVDVTGGGDSVRPAINVTGLAAAPLAQAAENNTVTFPGAGSTAIVAAFAEVSFPPNVTAMSVPADGLLELYVSVQQPPDARPLIERVAEALNVSTAGLELRRVVEVGDNETHIVFDMPVRILLGGQADGTAFYVNNTNNGTVMPIGTACAGDDTEAAHAQLGGMGECALDLGGDKVIYTYHLTEFSTVGLPTPLERAVTEAAAGTTVRVPAGTYATDMLVVDKPLTIEPADSGNPPVFTGHAHVVVRPAAGGGPVVVRGLVFEDTARDPAGAGTGPLASIIVEPARGAPPSTVPVTIEGNTFRNTCDAAVRVAAAADGAQPIAGLVIRDNMFYDIGGNRGSGGCAPAASGPGRADAIVAGRYDGAALAAGASAFAAQLANMTVRDNYIFGTTYTGIRIAAADGLVVEGNHVEGVPDDGIRVLASKSVAVRDNAIVGANSAPYAQAAAGGAGAAIEVWSGSDDVAVTLNRISGSAGAFYLCAGTCDPGPDAADGTGGAPATVPRAPINSDGGLNDVRFNHNVLAESNTGALIASGAAGMLNARSNYYPGYAASAGDRIAPAGAGAAAAAPVVSYAPALDDAGPVRIGAIVADGPSSPIRSIDSAVRAAFELGVHGFNARQAEIGGFVGLEPAVRAVDSPGSAAAARAGHAAALADLRSGASADARMLPVLHNSIASAMAAYDASGAAALAGISAMGATHGHYPFVNARNGTIAAHGANASLVGDAAIVRALAGGTDESLRALFDFENAAGIAGTGVDPGYPNASWKWWTYDFVDPATGGTVSKRSVLALHPGPDGALHGADDLVFGAGYYPGPGAAHLVVAAGDAPAAVNASDGVVIVSPASTAAQLAAPDMLFRLAPPDSKLAGAVLAQAAEGRSGAAGITVVALNDSASLQSMGLAGELARIDGLDALPDGVTAVRVVSYDSALDGWESGAAAAIRSALPQGSAAVYAGRADAFAALAAGFGSRAPENTKWYAAGELARADLAAAGPAAAALALAVQLTVLSQHAAPDAAIDAALALPGTGIALDASTRGPAYAAYDAPGLLGRAIASTAGVPGSPAGVAAAIEEDVARTHDGALGSPLILDRNGDLALPVTYAVSSFPDSIGGAWTAQPARVGELSCGIALERAVLDFGNLAPGQRSRVASQTVINTGTLTYETIRLAPTEWTYAGMSETLPASITELRELGRAAAFSDARTGIQIAQGLGPGMDRDLQYRIDLSGYQAIPAGQVSQTISYLVMCRDVS